MSFRRLLALLCIVTATLTSAHAHVKASLVAADRSVQPGRPLTVALKLEHEPHWHTYWINAGTGYPTSLAWTLPEGWTAGAIQWPTPIPIKDSGGNVTGNGYDDIIHLPVTLTPPAGLAPGGTVTLRAKADWLMCADVCVPGRADLELTLPVAAEAPQPDPAVTAAIAALAMPQPPESWKISAGRSGKAIILRLLATEGTVPSLTEPHFFSENELIAYDQPQTVRRLEHGYELLLPVSASADAGTGRLTGVLATAKPLAGLNVDVPIETGLPALSVIGAAGSAAAGSPPGGSFPGTLALAFVGGLILNLMPCVFPVLGLKILGFVNQAGSDRRKITLHGLIFTAGVLASFWALAGVLALLRAGGEQLGWGFQLQSPAFVYILAGGLLVFALSLSGVFEFGLSATSIGGSLQVKTGYSGSFFTGVLATVVATPCSAPFLAPALGAALALSVPQSFVVFTAIALGLSLPYLLLSIFPQAVRLLPRPGAWMETFKQFMAFPLYATVGYLVWVLAGQIDESRLLYALFGLVFIAMALWAYGRWTQPGASPRRARTGSLVALVLLVAGTALGYPKTASSDEIVWEKWSPEAVAALRAEGRTIYVDFTARWCATCQANKKLVFGSAEVREFFRDKKIATLKADWTNRDPQITAELARFNRSAVPFNLIYQPGAAEPIALPELLTPGTVLQILR